MACGFFRFRDQEFLKSLIFAKNETKILKLASLRQCGFSFPRKIQRLRTSKSLQSQNPQAISGLFPLLFPWLSIFRVKLNDIGLIPDWFLLYWAQWNVRRTGFAWIESSEYSPSFWVSQTPISIAILSSQPFPYPVCGWLADTVHPICRRCVCEQADHLFGILFFSYLFF